MGGESMTQCMRRYSLADTRMLGVAPDQVPECLARHRCAARGNEQRLDLPASKTFGARRLHVTLDPTKHLLTYRHKSFLATFADDAHNAHVLTELRRRH